MSEGNGNEVLLVEPEQPTISYKHTPTIGALVGALAKATKEFTPALKDARNPAYGQSRYAPLENLIEATRPALCANGLVVLQLPKLKGQNVEVSTLLAHSSGEWIVGSLELPGTMRERFDAQSVGSGITYARRYAYQSILNIAGEVDDDGNAAVGVGSKEAQQEVAKGKIADYQKRTTVQANGQVVEVYPVQMGDVACVAFVPGPAIALLLERGAKDFTIYSDNHKARFMPDDPSYMIQLAGVAKPLGITVKRLAQGPAASVVAPNGKPAAPSHIDDFIPPYESEPPIGPVIETAKLIGVGTKQFLSVQWGGRECSCWHQSMFEFIQGSIGKPAAFAIEEKPGKDRAGKAKTYYNIEGIEQIGSREYDEESKPVRTLNDSGSTVSPY